MKLQKDQGKSFLFNSVVSLTTSMLSKNFSKYKIFRLFIISRIIEIKLLCMIQTLRNKYSTISSFQPKLFCMLVQACLLAKIFFFFSLERKGLLQALCKCTNTHEHPGGCKYMEESHSRGTGLLISKSEISVVNNIPSNRC